MAVGLQLSGSKRRRQGSTNLRNKKTGDHDNKNAMNLWAVGKLGKFAGWFMPIKKRAAFTVHDDNDDDDDEDDSILMELPKTRHISASSSAAINEPRAQNEQQQEDHASVKPAVIDVPTPNNKKSSSNNVSSMEEELDSSVDAVEETSSPLKEVSIISSPTTAVASSGSTAPPASRASSAASKRSSSTKQQKQKRQSTHTPSPATTLSVLDDDLLQNTSPRPYILTCYAITNEGLRCSRVIKDKEFCENHNHNHRENHNHNHRENPRQCLLAPSIHLESDKTYREKPGTTRCRGISQRGARCLHSSVVKWDMCRRHLKFPPTSFVPVVLSTTTRPAATAAASTVPTSSTSSQKSKQPPPSGRKVDNDDDVIDDSEKDDDSETELGDINHDVSSHSSDDLSSSSSSSSSIASSEALIVAAAGPKRQGSSYHSDMSSDSSIDSEEEEEETWEEPEEYDHSSDTLFDADKGDEERCNYVSKTGEKCPYRTSDAKNCSSVYCHGHFPLMKRLESILEDEDGPKAPEQSDDSIHDDSSDEEDVDEQGNNNSMYINAQINGEPRPYTHKEFLAMWRYCEEYCGQVIDDIENTKQVRSANKSMCPEDTDGQAKAQYGRLLPRAMKVRRRTYYNFCLLLESFLLSKLTRIPFLYLWSCRRS
jgi:hypothetical protein